MSGLTNIVSACTVTFRGSRLQAGRGAGRPGGPTLPRDRGVITALIPLCGRLIRLLVSIPCGPDGHWFSLGYGNFQKAL